MDSGKIKKTSGMGVAVSTMRRSDNSEDEKSDSDKTVFDWCIEGDASRVIECLRVARCDVNATDENVRAPLCITSVQVYE